MRWVVSVVYQIWKPFLPESGIFSTCMLSFLYVYSGGSYVLSKPSSMWSWPCLLELAYSENWFLFSTISNFNFLFLLTSQFIIDKCSQFCSDWSWMKIKSNWSIKLWKRWVWIWSKIANIIDSHWLNFNRSIYLELKSSIRKRILESICHENMNADLQINTESTAVFSQ